MCFAYWSLNQVSNRTVLGQTSSTVLGTPPNHAHAQTKRLTLEKLVEGCLLSWIPKRESTENWHFLTFDKNAELQLSNGWSRSYMDMKTRSVCRNMSGCKVTGWQISIPIFDGTLWPMGLLDPSAFPEWHLRALWCSVWSAVTRLAWMHTHVALQM